MSKNTILAVMLAIAMVSVVGITDAEGKGRSATNRIDCIEMQNPTLSTNVVETVTDTFLLTVEVQQEFGRCLYDSGTAHTYILPYIPFKYEVKLVDTDFNEVVESYEVVGTDANTFQTPEWTIFSDIPYCVIVTSSFMSHENKLVEAHNSMCLTT